MATAKDYAEIFRMLIDQRSGCYIPDNIKLKIIAVLNDQQNIGKEVRREARTVNRIIES